MKVFLQSIFCAVVCLLLSSPLSAQITPCSNINNISNNAFPDNLISVGQAFGQTVIPQTSCLSNTGDNSFSEFSFFANGNASITFKLEIFAGTDLSAPARYTLPSYTLPPSNLGDRLDIPLEGVGGMGDLTFTPGEKYTFIITLTRGIIVAHTSFNASILGDVQAYLNGFVSNKDLKFEIGTSFSVSPNATNFSLTDLSGNPINPPVENGGTVDLCEVGDNLAVVWEPEAGQMVGSVHFEGAGFDRTENAAPYAMAGNSGNNYFDSNLDPGETYTIDITAYSGPNKTGSVVDMQTITFSTIQTIAGITSFMLEEINTGNKTPLTDGMVIDLSTFSDDDFNIEAIATTAAGECDEESVDLDLTGATNRSKTENNAAYEIAGGTGFEFNEGMHTLTATTYEKNNLQGTAGPTTTISFMVVASCPSPPVCRVGSEVERQLIKLYPNPASTSLLVEIEGAMEGQSVLKVVDMSGRVMIQKNIDAQVNGWTEKVSVQDFPAGVYHVTVLAGNQLYQKSFVKQ